MSGRERVADLTWAITQKCGFLLCHDPSLLLIRERSGAVGDSCRCVVTTSILGSEFVVVGTAIGKSHVSKLLLPVSSFMGVFISQYLDMPCLM